MPSARDLLQRFRPAGAPGPATATGVPADRVAERTAELEPVFESLRSTTAEVARIRHEAVVEAEHRREQAREQAVARVADARLEADAIRATTLADAQRDAEGAARASVAAAAARAESTTARSLARLDGDVEEVVRRLRASLAATTVERAP
ncbi:MAG TPA: hypothetical protein VHO29_12105 [Marmoricola sp.]|nr:hypothetical protein [Marmoricola sp.]